MPAPLYKRRSIVAGLAAAPLLTWALTSCIAKNDDPTTGHPALAPPMSRAIVIVADLQAASASATLRELAARARQLNTSAAVNVTIALGSSAFDTLALTDRRPQGLTVMPSFPGDVLTPHRANTDLLIQIEADTETKASSATATLIAGLPGLEVSWTAIGHRPENHTDRGRALTRNQFGFLEGFANPTSQATPSADDLTLIRPGDAPDWAVGGSYLAARVIQLAQELWDRDSVDTQERIIGRRRDGAWLDGTPADADPDFAADPDGDLTPLDAHVRRAHPRDGQPAPPLTRRSWTYTSDRDDITPNTGVLFMCYQRDLADGFEVVQQRMEGQALDLYLLTVGGGYYIVPPAGQDRWEDTLLAP